MKLADVLLEDHAVDPDEVDRNGVPVHPGDRVRFSTYPKGSAEGEVVVSATFLVSRMGGPTYRALAIKDDAGKVWGMPGAKHLLRLGKEESAGLL